MNREAVKQRFNIIGHAPRFNTAIDVAIQVAPTEVTVLVIGENGSGKDIFSKIIHQFSARKHKQFIAINCGAIPEGTIDSELFGHEKGSFTSAYDSRKGYFEEANGGVIFLDEIAEMPLYTQSRLLRVLENGEFLRVGSSKVQKTDVRVIAATNKNLVEAIRIGKFREDLYFRLNTVTIYVPPLRERGDDIELLFRYFSAEFAERYGRKPIQLLPETMPLLYDYHWPGNIRELRNFAEKLTVLVRENFMTPDLMREHLPAPSSQLPMVVNMSYHEPNEHANHDRSYGHSEYEFLLKALFEIKSDISDLKKAFATLMQHQFGGSGRVGVMPLGPAMPERFAPEPVETVSAPHEPETLSLDAQEKELIARALLKFNNNRKKAANELGISERTLYRKIRYYGID